MLVLDKVGKSEFLTSLVFNRISMNGQILGTLSRVETIVKFAICLQF